MRIYLSRPHMSGHEQAYVAEAFTSNFVAPVGPQLDAFEAAMAEYLGEGLHCVALSSGSAALHLALRIAGVEPGDEVWLSSMTFAGGVFPVNYLGAVPRFFDIDPKTWMLDANLLEQELRAAARQNRLPRAIVSTDLYGQSVDLTQFEEVANNYGIRLIHDSAESLGATDRRGRKAGSGGDAAVLSFNGNKIITTSGGGMFVSKHKDWAQTARFLATQARDPAAHYQHSTFGYNYRLSNICAAIGLGQMQVLQDRVERRRRIFDRYQSALVPLGFSFMPESEGSAASRWLTVVRVDPTVTGTTQEAIRLNLLAHQIETRPLWKPMHLQPLYAAAAYHGAGFDAELFQLGLCLPSGSDMSEDQQSEVIFRVANLCFR